jgi:ubiquinone/menaquinone biosynthesis C-methylase UbiE
MIEEFMSHTEYTTHFEELRGLRSRIARDLPIQPGSHILDVATGEGFFALAVAQVDRSLTITGIDIAQSVVRDARANIREQKFQDRIDIVKEDAAKMRFQSAQFDMAVNFTGLDEIAITRGTEGVQETFCEVNRVLKPRSYFGFVVMPPDAMETEAQKLEVAVFDHICGATYPRSNEYEAILKTSNFTLLEQRSYYTGMKFTPQQARREIRYTIEATPRIYGITTPSFEEVWSTFGRGIVEHGLGCYSKVVLMITQKVREATR